MAHALPSFSLAWQGLTVLMRLLKLVKDGDSGEKQTEPLKALLGGCGPERARKLAAMAAPASSSFVSVAKKEAIEAARVAQVHDLSQPGSPLTAPPSCSSSSFGVALRSAVSLPLSRASLCASFSPSPVQLQTTASEGPYPQQATRVVLTLSHVSLTRSSGPVVCVFSHISLSHACLCRTSLRPGEGGGRGARRRSPQHRPRHA